MPATESRASWLGPLLLRLGACLLSALLVAGLVRSLAMHHALPPVQIGYTNQLKEMTAQLGSAAVIPRLRSAVQIDFDSEPTAQLLLDASREAGDTEATLAALQAMVRFRPQDPQIRTEFVSSLLAQGRVWEAYEQGQVAVRLDPRSVIAYCNCGAALLGLDQKREAAAWYRKALELDPNSRTARMALEFPLRGF